eukprot:1159664-Pelagomonas_calceolata.AAC.8
MSPAARLETISDKGVAKYMGHIHGFGQPYWQAVSVAATDATAQQLDRPQHEQTHNLLSAS